MHMHRTEELKAGLAARYDIERQIAVGGMATVYLAHDQRHGRRVAVKVLNRELAAVMGPERFLAEISVMSKLHHPHLVPMFDSGEVNGQLFYVMPFIEGETLRARLNRERQLSIDDVVRYGAALCGALDYAHRNGVIHRDLKPENILLHEGEPLIMDFGISLALSTVSAERITKSGITVGTPHYMSPEQAAGEQQIDGRSDVYSLGAVLYESLAGTPPHVGPTAQAIIARVITEVPKPLGELRSTVPSHVEAAITRALCKVPADRYSTAAAFAEALSGPNVILPPGVRHPGAIAAPQSTPFRQTRSMAVVASAVVVAAATGIFLWTGSAEPTPQPSTQLQIALPESVSLWTGWGKKIAVSRDGARILFVGERDAIRSIYVQELANPGATRVPGTEGASTPEFSFDGRWIHFGLVTGGKASNYKVPIKGGTPAMIVDSGSGNTAWTEDNHLLFHRAPSQLHSITVDGQHRRLVASADSGSGGFGIPEPLPGSEYALVGVPRLAAGAQRGRRIGLLKLSDGSLTDLGLAGFQPRYVPGYIVFVRQDGGVYAAPFSLRRRVVTDSAVQIPGISVGAGTNVKDLGVADGGILIYRTAVDYLERILVAVDSTGREYTLGAPRRLYDQPRVSPDGKHIAMTILCAAGGCGDIWVFNVDQKTLSPVTRDSLGKRPIWSETGDRVEFVRDGAGGPAVASRRLDGSQDSTVFSDGTTDTISVREIARDGQGDYVILRGSRAGRGGDLYLAPKSNLRALSPFAVSRFNELSPRMAPGGQVVAYQSDESGRPEIYLRPVIGTQPRVPVSVGGGINPVWSRDGKTIYYRTPDRMIAAASVSLSPRINVSVPRMLFRDTYERPSSQDGFDALPDGRLVFIKPSSSREALTIVTNWPQLLRR
jgi:eukaryotic-like serine/threonine-protein kinase